MLSVEKTADLAPHVGQLLGRSGWVEISQKMIDLFAEATGDHQWIHVDVERAARESPGGKTIAHGYLTLSLLARLSGEIFKVSGQARSINYGSNRVRFMSPVAAGGRVRLAQTLTALEPIPGGARLIVESVMEIEGQAKPALAAETIRLTFDGVAGTGAVSVRAPESA